MLFKNNIKQWMLWFVKEILKNYRQVAINYQKLSTFDFLSVLVVESKERKGYNYSKRQTELIREGGFLHTDIYFQNIIGKSFEVIMQVSMITVSTEETNCGRQSVVEI